MSIRTGDTVLHRPSGERWLVAYVYQDYLAWCGWPEGEAKLSDCELIRVCTDYDHWELVKKIANEASGKRAWVCLQMLKQRTPVPVKL